jgi:hypothetical protein
VYGGGIELLFAKVLTFSPPAKYFVAAASVTAYTRVTITYTIR